MFLKRLLLGVFTALFLLGTMPEIVEAKRDKSAIKSKKKKRKRRAKKKKKRKKAPVEAAATAENDPNAENGDVETAEGSDSIDPEAEGKSKDASDGAGPSISGGGSGGEGSLRRSGRMEFDERIVKGQAAKSGAVYLFKRVPRHLPGLVPMRRSYRKRIVGPILGKRALKPAIHSAAKQDILEEAPPAEASNEQTPKKSDADGPADKTNEDKNGQVADGKDGDKDGQGVKK